MSVESGAQTGPLEWAHRYPWLFEWPLAVFDCILGIFGVLVGVIAPVLISLAPIEKQEELTVHGVWFVVFFIASVITRNMFLIPLRVGRHTATLENKVGGHVEKLGDEVGRAFYTGFYTLTAGDALREQFKKFDESFADPKISRDIRNIVFGFLAQSVAHVGESGLAMVDVEVGEYVEFLKRLLALSNQTVRATCVVRPYWFVSPEIPKISLPLRQKAGHLVPFRAYSPKPTRLAVYDERTIAEIMLTSFIDREISTGSGDCPNCTALSKSCPFHSRMGFTEVQIPEIHWFEKDVNGTTEGRVDLKYTHVNSSARHILSSLEDRVFLESVGNRMQLDVRFSFANLSTGTLWLRWGDKAQKFDSHQQWFAPYVFRLICGDDPRRREEHKVYESFWSEGTANCLLAAHVDTEAMHDYLVNVLQPHVAKNYTAGRAKTPDQEWQRPMLNDGVHGIVVGAITKLATEIKDNKPLREIYRDLGEFYRQAGSSDTAYLVSYDRGHPEVPVTVARWKENWEAIRVGG